jgi:hypothetical protein
VWCLGCVWEIWEGLGVGIEPNGNGTRNWDNSRKARRKSKRVGEKRGEGVGRMVNDGS